MPRTALQKVYADFRQGFVSVANPLSFPEGALKESINFDIKDNGTLSRRPGLEYESDNELVLDQGTAERFNTNAFSINEWSNVDNNANFKIAVIQVDTRLYFYEIKESGIDFSIQLDSSINLGISSSLWDQEISVTNGAGRLFIAHPGTSPFYLEYDNGSIDKKDIDIKIRDLNLWRGKNDKESGLERTSSLTAYHEYNLRNAGWPLQATVSNTDDPNAGAGTSNPIEYTRTKLGFYPTVSTPFHSAQAGGGNSVIEQVAFSPWQLENDYFGNTVAPTGHFIYSAASFSRQGNGNTGIENFSNSKTILKSYSWDQNPTTTAFYAGRVWYAGAKGYTETTLPLGIQFDPEREDNINVAGTLYFSQNLQNEINKVDKCYQEADPTSQDINQLVPTDGGTITLKEVGEIYSLAVYGTALLIFSDQGVWSVSGKDINSFQADNFSITKISDKAPSSRQSITLTNDAIYYVSDDAIYTVVPNEVTGKPSISDISSGRIKNFYNNITLESKQNSKLIYDKGNRILYVLYSEVEDQFINPINIKSKAYNKCLIFNQDLGCFYKYNFNINQSILLLDGIYLKRDSRIETIDPITSNGNPVTLDSEPVTLNSSFVLNDISNISFLTANRSVDGGSLSLKISTISDAKNWEDWGSPYESYVETGFDSAGDIMRDSKKAPVIITHMEKTEDGFEINPNDPLQQEIILTNMSGCKMSYGWDWATNYKNSQQIYRFNRQYIPYGVEDTFNYGQEIITTRNRIRGKGHSLGLELRADTNKDCKILGIGILYTSSRQI